MTAAEAHAAAAAEGLALVPGETATGFGGARVARQHAIQSFTHRTGTLGQFTTAEEAAPAVARALGPRAWRRSRRRRRAASGRPT